MIYKTLPKENRIITIIKKIIGFLSTLFFVWAIISNFMG